MIASERRLCRLLEKLILHPQVLFCDDNGQYKSAADAAPKLVVPAQLAKFAIERGLLRVCGAGQVEPCEGTRSWVKRFKCKSADKNSNINAFAAQHLQMEEREIFDEAGEMVLTQVNVATSPLLRLFRQKNELGERFLSPVEFAAGQKLRQDYAASAMGRMSCSNWMRVGRASGAASADSCFYDGNAGSMDARKRVMAALQAVGPVLDRVLFSTLIREQGLSAQEQDRQWPKSSSKIVLKIALSRLAYHYGLSVSHEQI